VRVGDGETNVGLGVGENAVGGVPVLFVYIERRFFFCMKLIKLFIFLIIISDWRNGTT